VTLSVLTGIRLKEEIHMADEKRSPERRSAIADAAATRWGETHPDEDIEHVPPTAVPEDENVVPNRHSASAEAAALRWREQHPDE
jgi:hypothetical protein